MASSCKNRSLGASGLPVPADEGDPVDNRPCAASNAFIVAGDICGNPSRKEDEVDFSNIAVPPKISKGSEDSRPKPVELADDDLDEVSEFSNSRTDDAV